jgi:hypothetical protein
MIAWCVHKTAASQGSASPVLSQAFEKRMAHFTRGRLRAVLDFGQQRRLNPYAAVRDAL